MDRNTQPRKVLKVVTERRWTTTKVWISTMVLKMVPTVTNLSQLSDFPVITLIIMADINSLYPQLIDLLNSGL